MCVWFVGRPVLYGMAPVQHGFGPQPSGLHPQFQYPGHPAVPSSRPVSVAPPRPSPNTAAIQRPLVTEQLHAGQPEMQFVPTQVIAQSLITLITTCLVIKQSVRQNTFI